MFNKIKTQLVLVLSALLVLTSCLEDEGNYDYNEINEVTIGGIEENYELFRLDNFDIYPELSFTQDNETEGRYTYQWQSYKVAGQPIDDNKLVQLSTERNLTVVASLVEGDHIIYYMVTDTVTGVEWQHNFNVSIKNSIYEGWLLLNEVEGEPRLDMVNLFNEEYIPLYDVLSLTNSRLKLEGTPKFIKSYYKNSQLFGIYITTTGNGTTRIDPDTFDWDESFNLTNEFGSPQPDIIQAQNIINKRGNKSFCILDGDIYYYYEQFAQDYSTPRNIVGGVQFEAAPMIATGSSLGNSIFYDNTNLRFVYYNGDKESYEIPAANSSLFDYNNVGKELLHLVSNEYNGQNNTQTFAVLKDPNDGKHHIARFSSSTFLQSDYKEILATDFDQATNIAISPEYGYLFYSVGGKVYEYDIYNETTFTMLDKGSEEISLLKFEAFAGGAMNKTLGYDLIVCSVDPAKPEGSNGTMEIYDVPPVNAQIELTNSFDGFGKIVSVSYRER